jgi:MFS family permease
VKKINNITIFKIAAFFEGLYFLIPVFVLFLNNKGITIGTIVLSQTLYSIGVFIGEVPTGIFADRFGQKNSLLAHYVFEILALILIFIFPYTVLFLCMTFIRGVASSFASGADEALLWETIKRSNNEEEKTADYKKVRATIESNIQMGTVVAALVGGVMYQFFGKHAFSPLIISTIVATAIGGFLMTFLIDYKKQEDFTSLDFDSTDRNRLEAVGFFTLFKESLVMLRSHVLLRIFVMIGFLVFTGEYFLQGVYQPYFELNGVPGFWIGAVVAIGALLNSVLFRYVHYAEKYVSFKNFTLMYGLLIAFCYTVLSVTQSAIVLAVVYVVMMSIFNLTSPYISHVVNSNINSSIRTTALSTISFVKRVFYTLIYAGLALLVSRFGTSNTFAVMALYLCCGSLVSYFLILFIMEKHENS